jgi:hypothetical protein
MVSKKAGAAAVSGEKAGKRWITDVPMRSFQGGKCS